MKKLVIFLCLAITLITFTVLSGDNFLKNLKFFKKSPEVVESLNKDIKVIAFENLVYGAGLNEYESFVFKGDVLDVKSILSELKAVVVNSYVVNGIYVFDCYSLFLNNKNIKCNQYKYNLQIALKENVIKMGSPLILDSF